MNLQPMNDPRPGQRVQCVECGKMIEADRETVYFDADGVPYKGYYHADCVPAVQIWQYMEKRGAYYFWKYQDSDVRLVYQCTTEPKPPTNAAGYYSFGYLLKVKGLLKGDTVQSIFQDTLRREGKE